MAVELASDSILVNAVAPSIVDTPMIEQATRASATTTYKPSGTSPLGRIAVPADIDGGTSAAYVPTK